MQNLVSCIARNKMLIKAEQKFARFSPRKLRQVVQALRGQKSPPAILAFLEHIPKRGAKPITKVIKQALANAKNNFNLATDNLQIREIIISSGPVYKRSQPAYGGRVNLIQKKTSHIKVILETEEKPSKGKEQERVEKSIRQKGETEGVKHPLGK